MYARSAFGALFGSSHLPGAIAFDNLPPGTTILAHSACLHGRRPQPGPGPRYFVRLQYNYQMYKIGNMYWSDLTGACVYANLQIDCSYCERIEDVDGTPLRQWCSYPNLVDITHQVRDQ